MANRSQVPVCLFFVRKERCCAQSSSWKKSWQNSQQHACFQRKPVPILLHLWFVLAEWELFQGFRVGYLLFTKAGCHNENCNFATMWTLGAGLRPQRAPVSGNSKTLTGHIPEFPMVFGNWNLLQLENAILAFRWKRIFLMLDILTNDWYSRVLVVFVACDKTKILESYKVLFRLLLVARLTVWMNSAFKFLSVCSLLAHVHDARQARLFVLLAVVPTANMVHLPTGIRPFPAVFRDTFLGVFPLFRRNILKMVILNKWTMCITI